MLPPVVDRHLFGALRLSASSDARPKSRRSGAQHARPLQAPHMLTLDVCIARERHVASMSAHAAVTVSTKRVRRRCAAPAAAWLGRYEQWQTSKCALCLCGWRGRGTARPRAAGGPRLRAQAVLLEQLPGAQRALPRVHEQAVARRVEHVPQLRRARRRKVVADAGGQVRAQLRHAQPRAPQRLRPWRGGTVSAGKHSKDAGRSCAPHSSTGVAARELAERPTGAAPVLARIRGGRTAPPAAVYRTCCAA